MERVVILGRGAAGKSTFATRLGRLRDLPVIELDEHYWTSDLAPTPPDQWRSVQEALTAAPKWILDGDLGAGDVLAPRLTRADTVIVFDFGLPRCAWQALRRSRERADFWRWLITWRRRRRAHLLQAIVTLAPGADLRVLRSARAARQLLKE